MYKKNVTIFTLAKKPILLAVNQPYINMTDKALNTTIQVVLLTLLIGGCMMCNTKKKPPCRALLYVSGSSPDFETMMLCLVSSSASIKDVALLNALQIAEREYFDKSMEKKLKLFCTNTCTIKIKAYLCPCKCN